MRRVLALVAIGFLVLTACSKSKDDASDDEAFPQIAFASDLPTFAPSPTPSATPTARPAAASSGSGGSSNNAGSPAAAPAPTTTKAPTKVTCPSGTVSSSAEELNSHQLEATGDKPGEYEYDVHIEGDVVNHTNSTINGVKVSVQLRIPNTDPKSRTATVPSAVGVGGTGHWEVDMEIETTEEPDPDYVRTNVSGWTWGDSSKSVCPTV